LIVDAAAAGGGCVTGEGAVADVQRASVADAAAAGGDRVTGESTVIDVHRAIAQDAAAPVTAGVAIGDADVGQGQDTAAGHVEDAKRVAAAALNNSAVAIDGDLASDGGQAVGALGVVVHVGQGVGAASLQVNSVRPSSVVGVGDSLNKIRNIATHFDVVRAGWDRAHCYHGQQDQRHCQGSSQKELGVFKSGCRSDPLRSPWAGARPALASLTHIACTCQHSARPTKKACCRPTCFPTARFWKSVFGSPAIVSVIRAQEIRD